MHLQALISVPKLYLNMFILLKYIREHANSVNNGPEPHQQETKPGSTEPTKST